MARKPLGYIGCYTDRVEWYDRLLDASRDKENRFLCVSLERKLGGTDEVEETSMTINDEAKYPDSVVELSNDVAGRLLKLLPKQSSAVISGGAITKNQLNTLLTLAINTTNDSEEVDVLVAAMLQYL